METTAERRRFGWSPAAWAGAALFALAFGLYAALTPAVSGDGDGSEFTLVLATAGTAHPSGYPLYTLLGHVFCRILAVFGAPPPLAANLWSALGAAHAGVFLYATSLRLVRRFTGTRGAPRILAALLPCVFLLMNPAWILVAIQAEVYSWHLAWVLGAAYLFTALADDADSGTLEEGGAARAAFLWGLTGGLGLAHHLTSVLVYAPLSVALLVLMRRRPALRAALPRIVPPALAGIVLPLASYAFVVWRASHPGVFQWPELEPGFSSVMKHVTGERYRQFLGHFAPSVGERQLLEKDVYPYLAVGTAALLWFAARSGVARGLAAAAAISTVYAFNYGVFDVSSYFLAPLALALAALAPLAAGPVAALRRGRSAAVGGGAGRVVAGAAVLLVVALAGAVQARWYRDALERRAHLLKWESTARSLWASVPDRPAIFLWAADASTRFVEYQVLRGEKPDVYVGNPSELAGDYGRSAFERRYGADPLEGLDIASIEAGGSSEDARQALLETAIARNVNRLVNVPVIYFDFRRGRLVELRKE